MTEKITGGNAARNAAKTLVSKTSTFEEKSVAGSALAQSKHPERVTSKRVASEAGRVLHDPSESPEAKSAAGSALAQRVKDDS